MPDTSLKFIFAGGGTGGHLYPAIALAQELEKSGCSEIIFIGTSYGIENKILPNYNFQFKRIWMRGLQRKITLTNLLFPIRLIVSIMQSVVITLSFKPDAIIGTGGYVSGPALLAGLLLGTPTVIQEQNSYPGLVNRLLGKKVKQVHIAFEDSAKYFQGQKNIKLSGNPVRNLSSTDKSSARNKFNFDKDLPVLLVFGGSQGARAINNAVLASLEELSRNKLQILWATGQTEFDSIATQCEKYKANVHVLPYLEDMASAYAAADFVLCRAGASTLSEIAICGLPSILVPYPFAAANHQAFNARSFEKSGAAIVLPEKNLNQETLTDAVMGFLNNPNKKHLLSKAALKNAKPDATKEIIKDMFSLIKTGG